MKRFQQLIVEAKAGRAAWEPLPAERIPLVARQLTASDIADVVGALDELAREKSEAPEWDGDTRDDIARAQELFARILCAVPPPLAASVAGALDRSAQETRDWVAAIRAERDGR